MTTRLLGLLAVPLLLAGCAAGEAAARTDPEAGPPDRASMVCGPEIAGEVRTILSLDEAPPTSSTWAEQVYTCTYDLPVGPLVLSVVVSESDSAADRYFDDRQAAQPAAEAIVGLGERAFGTGGGDVTVVKDDMTLTVDATALPEVFGDNGQKRSAFAFSVASEVLGCWTHS